MITAQAGQMQVSPVVLEGRYVRLEPMIIDHVQALAQVGLDEELWRWIPVPVRTAADMKAYVETALQERDAGTAVAFVQIERASGRVVGSTRYANIDRTHHRVENRLDLGGSAVAAHGDQHRGQVLAPAARV
jgi:N-acetyltransferase